MKCESCKEPKIVSLDMGYYTPEELEIAYKISNKPNYTKEEIDWLYNLYNRVFSQSRKPGCGKCFVNIRKQLVEKYRAENG